MRRYKVILEWNEEGGGYAVTVPALPGCVTEGDTLDEALENWREAIQGYLEALQAQGRPPPGQDVCLFLGEVEVGL